MKSKPILLTIVLAAALLVGILYLQGASHTKLNPSVGRIGKKGLSVGDSAKNLFAIEPYDHQKAIRAIDEASKYRMGGDSFSRQGMFDRAAEEYKKAYMIDVGSRAVSGLLLAMTYEKLGCYDDGIILLDRMIQNGELSKNGVKNANAIKSRLLAAKAAQQTAARESAP